jgi:hypothetical protein
VSVDHAELHETKRDAVLRLLSDTQWHSHVELARIGGVRYGARVRELKRLGYQIETQDIEEGTDGRMYRLSTTIQGMPAEKRVKAFLLETDVHSLLAMTIPNSARKALEDALGSFLENKHKL